MPSPLLGMAAGAGDPIRDILNRIQQDQMMQQRGSQLDETIRSNKADERLKEAQIQANERLRTDALRSTQANQATIEGDKQDASARSRIAMRMPGSIITPQEKLSDRGQLSDSAYTFQPENMGASVAGPGPDNPEAGPGGEVGPTPSRFQFEGTDQQRHQKAMEDKQATSADPFENTTKGLIPRSVLRGMFDKGTTLERPVQPDRVIMPTDQGLVRRSTVAAAADKGAPMQPQATSSTRTMSEGAKMLQPHIQDVKAQAADLEKAGLFGPLMSRVRHLAEKAGSIDEFQALLANDTSADDYRVGKFASSLALLASGTARVHYGGRAGANKEAYSRFKEMLGDASTLEMFNGRIDAVDDYMGGYAKGPGGSGSAATPAKSEGLRYDMNGNLISKKP